MLPPSAYIDDSWLELRWTQDSSNLTLPIGRMSLAKAGDFSLKPEAITETLCKVQPLLDTKNLFYCQQEHTQIVHLASLYSHTGEIGDGMLTQEDRIVLAVTVADCLPLLLWDCRNKVRGLLHSGWKGTGIVIKAIQKMQKVYGTQLEDLYMLLGPSIRSCCYRVDEERAQNYRTAFGEGASVYRDGEWYLDLIKANVNLAKKLGIRHLEVVDACTYCDGRFHSFRRQGKDRFQRMLVLF